ncbi:MAG TPA: hypothetical protein VMM82_12075 [Spirochaetia bacterium]|nr:hypothetical protein [Spirochaetia bacterium]
MKTSTKDILFIFVGLFVSIGALWASRAGVEMRLGGDVAYLNSLGRTENGEKSLSQSLESKFAPGPGQIADLRKQRLGYGDISVVFATASRLHGGMSRVNIERIVSLWRNPGSGGWGKVIRTLGVRVERVVLQIETVRGQRQVRGAQSLRGKPVLRASQARVSGGSAAVHPKGYDPVLRLVHGG